MLALNRPDLKLLLLTIATFVAMTIAAPDALAGSDTKRSAGSMRRSTGTEHNRGSTTGSSASGRSSMRTNRRSGPQLPSEKKKRRDDDKKKTESRHSSDDDDEDWVPDFGSRSLGKLCMYGPRGEVVFRPRGARCQRDAPAALDRSTERQQDSETQREATSRSTAAAPDRFGPPAKRRPSRPPPVSECVYGSEGQVLHTPAGGFCRPGGPGP